MRVALHVICYVGLALLCGCESRSTPSYTRVEPATGGAASGCDAAMVYQVADAHPEIRWPAARAGASQDRVLGCVLRGNFDDATIELKDTLSSGVYGFVRDCPANEQTRYRLFEYKNKQLPYLLRLHSNSFVDPSTYIVVSSHRYPQGHQLHQIAERSNSATALRYCPP